MRLRSEPKSFGIICHALPYYSFFTPKKLAQVKVGLNELQGERQEKFQKGNLNGLTGREEVLVRILS